MTHWILPSERVEFLSLSFFFLVLWSSWSVDIAGIGKAGDWRNYGVIGVEEGRLLERAMDSGMQKAVDATLHVETPRLEPIVTACNKK